MGSFYASILYSKTQEPQDAVLYARSLLTKGGQRQSQAKRVVRLLEQGGLFTHTNTSVPKALRLEAILLATQALAELQEWTALLTLVEDPHLYASLLLPDDRSQTARTIATATNSNSRKNALLASQPIDDDDSVAWQALANVLPLNPTEIHPLAQLLNHRAQAYAETGHPLRAATFYQLALKTDPKCFASLDGLLQDNPLLSATQVLDLVQGLERRPPAWLQDLYLARIHVAAPTIGIPLTNILTAATTNDDRSTHLLDTTSATHTTLPHPDKTHGDSFWKDASSLEFLTPIERAGVESSAIVDNALIGGIGGSHADSSALDRLLDEYKLRQSPDVLAMAAQRAFRLGELNQALQYCLRLTQLDPLCTTAAYVQVATLVALGHKRALFRLAHEWVEASPQSAASWFAVGSYYYACGRFHVAQRHFCRATRLDPQVVAAWMAFGCSFAAVEESDQALASFRAAQRLAPGDATSLLYIGMEYLRTNHTSLAQHFLTASHQIHASALVQNELGVYCLREKYFDQAASWFVKALSGQPDDWQTHSSSASSTRLVTLLERVTDPYWEPTVFNLAYALRKMRRFDAALACLERSCTLCPDHASAWSARGFVCHLDGELDQAIDFYHQALACKPKDPFSSEMLQRALTDALSQTSELLQNISLEGNRTNHHHYEDEIDAPLVRRDKVRLATSGSSKGRPRESINSMAMSDDGLSISVESMGDVDMG
jgi:anaphase-promoting complex subunit 6